MRVVAYSIKAHEKESLARANQKKHDITLIANPLANETLHYAAGKDAVLIGPEDTFDHAILNHLESLGIKFILMRCPNQSNIKTSDLPKYIHFDCLAKRSTASKDRESEIRKMAKDLIDKLDAWQQANSTETTAELL